MSDWKPTWNLTTIPEKEFNSERGRRHALKTPHLFKFKPCEECGKPLNATQRRDYPCIHCGHKHKRR